jgi:hypothetical protein
MHRYGQEELRMPKERSMTIETPEVPTETDTSEIQLDKEKMTQGIFTFNHVWPEALNGWHRLTLDLPNLPITPNSRVAASACEVKPGGTPPEV